MIGHGLSRLVGRLAARAGIATLIAALAAGLVSGFARAASYEEYTLYGYEVWYSPTRGTFVGTGGSAAVQLTAWYASIEHSLVVSPSGTVTGGWARLYRIDGVQVAGVFGSGLVEQTDEGYGCTAETHVVSGSIYGVTRSDTIGPPGAGTFSATLVHHRTWIFGRCITYSASISARISIVY